MDWGYVIGIIGTVASICFEYLAFRRNDRHDQRADARQDGVMLTELGYIKGGVDDIKAEQREQRKVNTELYTRMSAVESSAKQAHHRIDRLERREDTNEQ